MKRSRRIVIIIVLILAVILVPVVVTTVANDNTRVVVYDNVNVITEENQEAQPVEVNADNLVFNQNPEYDEGDIIVAGIIDSAPNGFIRKVVSISEINREYVIETENAFLTDVFKKANITATFEITEDEINEVDFDTEDIPYLISENSNTDTFGVDSAYALSTKKYGFTTVLDYELAKNLSASGEAGFNVWLESNIKIKHGNIDWGAALHTETKGELSVDCSDSISKEFSKEILNKDLKAIQFMAGEVPIVITNELDVMLDGKASLNGSIGTSMNLGATNTAGFHYSSKTGKIEEVFDREYTDSGIEWNTEANAKGEIQCGVSVGLLSKLYDCTGARLNAGISDSNVAQVCVATGMKTGKTKYVGKIDMEVLPIVTGDIVVSIPIVDKKLIDQQLFEVELDPLWEKHWESSANWEKEYEKYKPKEEWEQTYRAIIQDMKKYDSNSKVYFVGMYYASSVTNPPEGRGGVSSGYQLNSGQLKYMLKDISSNEDGIPELFIGNYEDGIYEILAIYSYDKASRCAELVSNKDDEYNTFDIYLDKGNMIYEGTTYSGGEFIALFGCERMPMSVWRTGQDEGRLVDTNSLKWNNLNTWN